MPSAIERDVDSAIRPGKKQICVRRIFADDAHEAIARQIARDRAPRRTAVVGNEEIRTIVAHQMAVACNVCRIVRRVTGFDADATPGQHGGRLWVACRVCNRFFQ